MSTYTSISSMGKYNANANAEGGQPSSPSIIPSAPTKEMPTTLAQSPTASATSGLDLLFAASQVETKPNATTIAEADRANAVAEVPSTVTVVSTGTGISTGRAEPGGESASNSDDEEEEAPSSGHAGEKTTTGADAVNAKDQKKVDVKTFPQLLQIILNTPEYDSIAHWLPDGLSFIIVDKQRFSDEILPKYFRRGALFHSFIRKLNRYGFRRVKGSCKGEESSFAHNDFVRDKPWLCLKMNCQSKPSYHKVPSTKKKTQQAAAAAAVEAVNNNRFGNANSAGLIAMPTAVSPTLMGVGGMMDAGSRAFVTTTAPVSYLPAAASHSAHVLPMTTAAIGPPTSASTIAVATAAAIQERQLQRQLDAPMLPAHYHQRILHEKQMLVLQMRQRHQRQMQLQQRLQEMSVYDEDHFPSSSYDSYMQSSLMAQSARDMLLRNIYY